MSSYLSLCFEFEQENPRKIISRSTVYKNHNIGKFFYNFIYEDLNNKELKKLRSYHYQQRIHNYLNEVFDSYINLCRKYETEYHEYITSNTVYDNIEIGKWLKIQKDNSLLLSKQQLISLYSIFSFSNQC